MIVSMNEQSPSNANKTAVELRSAAIGWEKDMKMISSSHSPYWMLISRKENGYEFGSSRWKVIQQPARSSVKSMSWVDNQYDGTYIRHALHVIMMWRAACNCHVGTIHIDKIDMSRSTYSERATVSLNFHVFLSNNLLISPQYQRQIGCKKLPQTVTTQSSK